MAQLQDDQIGKSTGGTVKAVLFDLGRVLVHYDHEQTLQAVATLANGDLAALHNLMQEISVPLGKGELDAEELYALFVDKLGLTADLPTFIDAFAAGITRDEEALAYALSLQNRADTTVAVISNTNDAHVRWLDQHVPELMTFDLVMMSNEVGALKPSSVIYELALELLSLLPVQAIFVDDLATNVEAAIALGMAGIVHHDWAETRPQVEAWLAANG